SPRGRGDARAAPRCDTNSVDAFSRRAQARRRRRKPEPSPRLRVPASGEVGGAIFEAAMLKRFFSYYRPHRGLFLLDFSCAVVAGLLELGFPMAVRAFIDDLLPSRSWGLILAAAAALLVIYLINAGLMIVVNYWGHMLGISIETEMRRKAFDHLQKLSFG